MRPQNMKTRVFFHKHIGLTGHWKDYGIHDVLTDTGIDIFSSDWNALIQ
jgi:hypothetical protein